MSLNDKQFIDVRSPAEFGEYALPGAVNIPLFSNEERAYIGTVYKKSGKQAALKEGLKIVGPKLAGYYEEMQKIEKEAVGKDIIVYCWRGGMRSRSFVSTMNMLGISCTQLPSGIRSVRDNIREAYEKETKEEREYIVLAGGTGTGKTKILCRLESEGYPVLNLESLANHRGSAFGQIGLKRRSQKQFDIDLWQRVSEIKESPYFIIEAEGKRIGHICLPEFILQGIRKGRRIEVKMPLKKRAAVLLETYQPWKHHVKIEQAINKIENKIPDEPLKKIYQYLKQNNYQKVAELLLLYYYDPRYRYTDSQYKKTESINGDSTADNYEQIKFLLDREFPRHSNVV